MAEPLTGDTCGDYTLQEELGEGGMGRVFKAVDTDGQPVALKVVKEEMTADLRSAGFVVREDSGMADWNERFAQGRAKVERGYYMRIAISRH